MHNNYHIQSAFLAGRPLLHSVMVANEVVDKVRWKKKKYLILKFVLRCLMTQSVGISFFE